VPDVGVSEQDAAQTARGCVGLQQMELAGEIWSGIDQPGEFLFFINQPQASYIAALEWIFPGALAGYAGASGLWQAAILCITQ
jgi:hypothetical protein